MGLRVFGEEVLSQRWVTDKVCESLEGRVEAGAHVESGLRTH